MTEAQRRWTERKRCERLGIEVPEWARVVKERRGNKNPALVSEVKPISDDIPEWKVVTGDCRRLIADVPWNAFIISDPPYNQKYHYDVYSDDVPTFDYRELIRVVFGGRRSVIVHYPEETINVLAKVLGDVLDSMAWVYPANQPKQHRLATWWNCRPDWRKTPQEYKNPKDKRVAKLIADGKSARGYDWIEIDHVKNVADAGHPCPIPYALAERLVLATTEPGDLVVDPFCGSGTILQAAVRNGRRAHGFELSPAYCETARSAIKAATQQTSLRLVSDKRIKKNLSVQVSA